MDKDIIPRNSTNTLFIPHTALNHTLIIIPHIQIYAPIVKKYNGESNTFIKPYPFIACLNKASIVMKGSFSYCHIKL